MTSLGHAALATALADRYRLERELGTGGMATVYLAHDLKHDRKVAIKVLKPELAAVLGAERFVVEIKTTAALQHPHILPLFDSGTTAGHHERSLTPGHHERSLTPGHHERSEGSAFLYYVMPYIQGETIREKLNRETQFGVDEAIRIAREVADALDYAHRHGVIHRDIKPENILLHDGRAMVMDFGIALAVSAAAGGRMTETGLSLGTPHYMSPEQATAEKDLTPRSDIYSLGSVLYEMLSGDPPHTGASAQQVIMKIITEVAAPVTTLRKSVPPNVAAAVARSIEKLPADRFESAKAFGDALVNPSYASTTFTTVSSGIGGSVRRASNAPLIAASLLAAAALAGWITTALRATTPPVKHTRFTIVVPDSARIRPEAPNQNFAISPDGSEILYRGGAATDQLYVRSLNDLGTRPIPGTERASHVRFSPDGRWLAFTQNLVLKKILMTGGPAVIVADSVESYSWGDGDVIVFVNRGALWRVSASGGAPTPLAKPDTSKGPASFVWPHLLPGGKALLFDIVTASNQAEAQLAATRLDDGKIVPLGVTGRNPRYVATGHILFGRLDGTVAAVPFDPTHLRVTGPAVTVLDNVYTKSGGAGEYGVARDGTLFFVQGTSNDEIDIVNRAGESRALLAERRGYLNLRYSPTGGRFAFQMPDKTAFTKTDIWVYNDLTKTVTRLTNDGNSSEPAWMADGQRVVWMFRDSSGLHARRQRWDGTGTPEPLFSGERNLSRVTPSPAGNNFIVEKQGGFTDMYVADGEQSALRPLVVTPRGEGGARFSPDGRWVAYAGDESGQREIYVIAVSGDGGRHQISTDGGAEPVWSPDGKTVYYRAGGKLIAAGIVASPSFTVTRREALFTDRFRGTGFVASYDVSRDDRSFLMSGANGEAAQRIIVVTGWLDELKERMAQASRK